MFSQAKSVEHQMRHMGIARIALQISHITTGRTIAQRTNVKFQYKVKTAQRITHILLNILLPSHKKPWDLSRSTHEKY